MTEPIRVRIAPSPTGTVHLGLARTSLFNWAYARRLGGTFVLRIEDTDRTRSTAESETAILEGLGWLGIQWDEGPDVGGPHAPYRQSERVERHLAVAEQLRAAGHAYRCFCSAERLEEVRAEQQARQETPRYDRHCRDLDPAEAAARAEAGEAFTLRFRVPEGVCTFQDLVRGEVTIQNVEVDDWIMVRQGASPTYNFVVVCDDADMQITHVLRGEEHLVNTPKQLLLYRALDLAPPQFGHLPLMLGQNRKKLSKRDGSVSLDDYIALGYPKKAILNFLCLQGWALDGETEVFSMAQMVAAFDLKDVSKGGSIFDFEKFHWMAGEYLREESVEELADHCASHVVAAGLMTADELAERREWYLRVVAQEQERIRLYSELPARIRFYFEAHDAVTWDPKAEKGARKRGDAAGTLRDYAAWVSGQDLSNPAALGEASKAWVGEQGKQIPELFQPLRCALTGLPGGPDLFEVMVLLGPEAVAARLRAGAARFGVEPA
ncbi:MAG: glutamate--tRNA ligase [Planctomycetota bacterium]|nr:glutamate--tRNA ligase [Planctomycetota bacterium]